MNRMDGDLKSKAGRRFLRLVSRLIETRDKMRRTLAAELVMQAGGDLTKSILDATDHVETIEELIHLEMVLQSLDRLSAQSPRDDAGIENAQRDYRQLAQTVAQIRRNPEEYFKANIALRDTGGDFRKLPRGRVQQIHANIARLRNRASFAPEDEHKIWNARIKLAQKTEKLLRALHSLKAKEYYTKPT